MQETDSSDETQKDVFLAPSGTFYVTIRDEVGFKALSDEYRRSEGGSAEVADELLFLTHSPALFLYPGATMGT